VAQRPRRSRLLLGAALALGIISKGAFSGCAAGTDPPSKINSLRVLVVTADKPYAAPGETVHFRMEAHDGIPRGEGEEAKEVQIAWIGGCFDPPGDLYYACFEEIARALNDPGSAAAGEISLAAGPSLLDFSLAIPEDIISRRPPPEDGPYYGIAYVFFAACAGELLPVPPTSEGVPTLPFGCFDEAGRAVGAEGFVPGYTQIYAFADGRRNANPAGEGFVFDGALVEDAAEDPEAMPVVKRCPLSDDERRAPGCSADDPFEACASYAVDVRVREDIAEPDAQSPNPNGGLLNEIVWVDYHADKGDLDGTVRLITGAVEGYHADHDARWLPPDEPGVATLWAILRDSRGGAKTFRQRVRVE
jgi:hypothetical protein